MLHRPFRGYGLFDPACGIDRSEGVEYVFLWVVTRIPGGGDTRTNGTVHMLSTPRVPVRPPTSICLHPIEYVLGHLRVPADRHRSRGLGATESETVKTVPDYIVYDPRVESSDNSGQKTINRFNGFKSFLLPFNFIYIGGALWFDAGFFIGKFRFG